MCFDFDFYFGPTFTSSDETSEVTVTTDEATEAIDKAGETAETTETALGTTTKNNDSISFK